MLWLSRPPYLAWAVAMLIGAMTLWIELRPTPVVMHPYATEAIVRGAPIDEVIELRAIPAGVLEPAPRAGYAVRPIAAGAPLLPGDVAAQPPPSPDGWWSIDLDLPTAAAVGDAIQLIVLPDPGQQAPPPIEGVVTRASAVGAFGDSTKGSAAFAPDRAALAAVAVAEGRVSVLIANGSTWDFANSG